MPKKPKLTAAEKKQLALLKKRQLQHDFLSREVKYGDLTLKRHEKEWRQMLIDIALPRVKEDLLVAWHKFERALDDKNFSISLLMDEINYCEEQYMRNLRGHCENIDNLLAMFRDNLNEMKTDYNNYLDKMQNSGDEESNEISSTNKDKEEYMKTMIYSLEMEKKRQRTVVLTDYLSRVGEEETKYTDQLQSKRALLENSFSNLWDRTIQFLNEYYVRTDARYKEYSVMNQQDETMQKTLVADIQKLQKFIELIKKMKQDYQDLQKSQERIIKDLKLEREYFADAFSTLKLRLKNDIDVDKNKLSQLTSESNDRIENLETILKKGEQLLTLSGICRKFETEQEKVLAFPSDGPLETNENFAHIHDMLRASKKLKLFWQHVAQADAVRCSMNEEKRKLQKENAILKRELHEYCACFECPGAENFLEDGESSSHISVTDGYCFLRKYEKYPNWHF